MNATEQILASVVPLVPFRADTPMSALLTDRDHWLALSHALADYGYVMTDSDAREWVTVADMVESVNAARIDDSGGDDERP